MNREVMLGKLVFAEELPCGVGGDQGEPIRTALEHVIAVVRALVGENATETSPSASRRAT